MRGLFTMLFGAGMLLMLRRAEDAQPQVTPFDVWSRRCLALMALGIVQFVLFLWPGEILFTYGVSGLALLAFRTARIRTLLIVSAVMFVGMGTYLASNGVVRAQRNAVSLTAAASKAVGRPLTMEQRAALDGVKQAQDSLHPIQLKSLRRLQSARVTRRCFGGAWTSGRTIFSRRTVGATSSKASCSCLSAWLCTELASSPGRHQRRPTDASCCGVTPLA